MDFLSSSCHLCYFSCTFCNIVLAVGIPGKGLFDPVTVKCGHCGNISFLSTRTLLQTQYSNLQPLDFQNQTYFGEDKKTQVLPPPPPPPPPASNQSNLPFVVKPPEKRHRLPSAYNRFMKEEIERIKVANPNISHREAFSSASKNWARNEPHPYPMTLAKSKKMGLNIVGKI